MLVLYETSGGFALFKHEKPDLVKEINDKISDLKNQKRNLKNLKLVSFQKFEDSKKALETIKTSSIGKISKDLKSFLKRNLEEKAENSLVVSDPKLGKSIGKKFKIQTITNQGSVELMRTIKENIFSLIDGLEKKNMKEMCLGLAHAYSKDKIKLSSDKIDLMVVQAVSLLDDLDKDINIYAMRLREWYGWHFPEMGKIITDNNLFAQVVKKVGFRENIFETDLSEIITEDIQDEIRNISKISMGTEISQEDLEMILGIAEQVIQLLDYRTELSSYLTNRMNALAPNITSLIGELLGARLISHTGSVMNLCKKPSSTIQMIGAEKALFDALKTNGKTPKYGLIFNSSLISKASSKMKGPIARALAAKISLAARVDSFKEGCDGSFGSNLLLKLERNLKTAQKQEEKKSTLNKRKQNFVKETWKKQRT